MPFKSPKQRAYLHANEPEMAQRWEKETMKKDEKKEAKNKESKKSRKRGKSPYAHARARHESSGQSFFAAKGQPPTSFKGGKAQAPTSQVAGAVEAAKDGPQPKSAKAPKSNAKMQTAKKARRKAKRSRSAYGQRGRVI